MTSWTTVTVCAVIHWSNETDKGSFSAIWAKHIFHTHKKKKRANKVLPSANWKPDGRKRGGKRFTLGRMVPDSEPMEIREEKRTEEDRTFFGSSNPPFSLSSSSGRLRKILHIHPIQAALETFFKCSDFLASSFEDSTLLLKLMKQSGSTYCAL